MKNAETTTLGRFDSVWNTLSEWLLPERVMKRRFWPIAIAAAYVLAIHTLGGLRSDHITIAALVILDSYNQKSRLFLKYFFPFILTGVVYDSMRYFYWQGIEGHVHVEGPHARDLAWFGIPTSVDGHPIHVTPNEYFMFHQATILDLLCGFAYLVFVGEYLLTAFFLFFTRKFYWLKRFGWSFFIVNVMGFITYFIYPAAPPWYVSQYGMGPARMDIHPTSAAAARFDQILGTHFFDQIYGRGVDVYGAYPSLHVTYPFLVMLITFQITKLKIARAPAVLFYALMCFSAVYLQHHYVVDILLGTTYATFTWLMLSKLLPAQNAKASA